MGPLAGALGALCAKVVRRRAEGHGSDEHGNEENEGKDEHEKNEEEHHIRRFTFAVVVEDDRVRQPPQMPNHTGLD